MHENKVFNFDNLKIVLSAIAGSIIGLITTIAIDTTLAEISLNPFFSLYFGMLYIGVGLVLYSKTNSSKFEELVQERKNIVRVISALIIISGILCIVLNVNLIQEFSSWQKVPFYGLLGMTLSFTMIFCLLDAIGCCLSFCTNKSVVDGKKQLNMIFVLSSVMGIFFGVLFGVLDVEDANLLTFIPLFAEDLGFSIPFGLIIGFIGGGYNQYLKNQQRREGFQLIKNFDEEI